MTDNTPSAATNPTAATLAAIKTALRLSDTAYDEQLTRLYKAAVADMTASGVPVWATAGEDSVTVEAAILYIKGHFNNSPDDSAKWDPVYDKYVAKFAVDAVTRGEAILDD